MTDETVKALRESLGRLNVQRKSLEMESEAIVDELTAAPEGGGDPMGIDTPLVDREGYPRGDIDVYRARDLRHRLSVIRTDHKSLMQQIERLLAQLATVQVSESWMVMRASKGE
jgi:Nas2 N_terminal domain